YRLGKLAQTIEPMDIIARSEKIRHAATRLKGLVERVRLAAEVGRGEILLNREAIEAVPFLEYRLGKLAQTIEPMDIIAR
ncbi:hypothetical protein CS022_24865, partial [Veronia nyctiphanis]